MHDSPPPSSPICLISKATDKNLSQELEETKTSELNSTFNAERRTLEDGQGGPLLSVVACFCFQAQRSFITETAFDLWEPKGIC